MTAIGNMSVILVTLLGLAGASGCGQGSEDVDEAAAGDTDSAAPGASDLAGTVSGDGSSTVFPIMEAVAEEFQNENPDVRVTVGTSGTGGGFKKFCKGETDISNASRPIKSSEAESCAAAGVEFIEIPLAFDGLSIVVNPENEFAQCMKVAELKKLWQPEAQGKIMRWNQVRAGWPREEVRLYGPGTDSGTYDYFTEAIVGEEGASRGDFTSSEDDNVLVQGVSGDQDALGFFGFAYFEENSDRLRLVQVDGGQGCVSPSPETIAGGTYQPLSRPLFVYMSKSSLARPEVRAFADYAITNAVNLVGEVGYVPLTDDLYRLARERVSAGTTGSIYAGGGSQVGTRLQDLLQASRAGGQAGEAATGGGSPADTGSRADSAAPRT